MNLQGIEKNFHSDIIKWKFDLQEVDYLLSSANRKLQHTSENIRLINAHSTPERLNRSATKLKDQIKYIKKRISVLENKLSMIVLGGLHNNDDVFYEAETIEALIKEVIKNSTLLTGDHVSI